MKPILKALDIAFYRIVFLLRQYLGEKTYILLLCIFVGVLSGFAAIFLSRFTKLWSLFAEFLAGKFGPWAAPAIPALGIFLTALLIRIFYRGKYDKSLAGVIEATNNGSSEVPWYHCFSHLITSGITVGMGGSAGLEAPIALTGSAIGSNTARLFRTGVETRTLLLACGGASGIAAIFNSPVAGTLFACEILLPSFSIPALIPLLMSSAIAAVLSEICGENHLIFYLGSSWNTMNLPFYVLLGILAGFISVYTIKVSVLLSQKLEWLKNPLFRFFAGACFLYVVFLLLPGLSSQGYKYIAALVNDKAGLVIQNSPIAFLFVNKWAVLAVCFLLVFLKVITATATLESGGDGGIFAPSMFIGAFTGFCVARAFNLSAEYFGIAYHLPEINFLAVGMGGVLAGVMHAPMTGMFLIAEMTGGYKLFIPLMIVVSLSSFISKRFARYNIYKSAIQVHGGAPEPKPALAALEKIHLYELVETDFVAVKSMDRLRDLIRIVMTSRKNNYPVLDEDGCIIGIVSLDDVRKFLLDEQLYDVVLVYDIMSPAGPSLEAVDSLASAIRIFEANHCWMIPVTDHGRYIGFVSKGGVFDRYRGLLRDKPELF